MERWAGWGQDPSCNGNGTMVETVAMAGLQCRLEQLHHSAEASNRKMVERWLEHCGSLVGPQGRMEGERPWSDGASQKSSAWWLEWRLSGRWSVVGTVGKRRWIQMATGSLAERYPKWWMEQWAGTGETVVGMIGGRCTFGTAA